MLSMMSSSSSDTTMNDADAGRLDKYYETQCILEGRVKPTMNDIDFSDEVHAFAALFNNGGAMSSVSVEATTTSTSEQPSRDSVQVDGKTFTRVSYIQKWRNGVNQDTHWNLTIHAPHSPVFRTFGPMSPVAIVHPDALRVTSAAPYETTSDEDICRGALPQFLEDVDEEEDDFEMLLDLETDDLDAESVSSSSLTVVLPTFSSTPKGHGRNNITHRMKWIPSRFKYKLLATSRKGTNLLRG